MTELTISVGESRRSNRWVPQQISWGALCDKLRTPVRTTDTVAQWAEMSRDQKAEIKDVGGFVGGVVDGQRKAGAVQSRQIITLDADFATSFDEVLDTWEMMVGKACLLHTTHSDAPGHTRLRMLIPLTRPVDHTEYEPIARRLAEAIDIEIWDDTTYEYNRLMFWPSCCIDAVYRCEVADGSWVDPDEVLASYADYRDMRQWPLSSRQNKAVRKMADRQGDPLTKPGIIGAFNRTYRITDAIVKYLPDVYTPAGPDRWTYVGGTTTGGAVTYDDDTFLYSHHDTDPTHGRLCSAFDLVRLHKYGELDEGKEAQDLNQLPSMAAMKQICAADEAVRDELAEAIRANQDDDMFDASPDDLERFAGDLSDLGVMTQFLDQYGLSIKYSTALGWMLWDGVRWCTDAEADVHTLLMRFSDTLYCQARLMLTTAEDECAKAEAKALMKAVMKLRSTNGPTGMARLLEKILTDYDHDKWDSRAWELNTPAGIVDLQTGAMRPHDKNSQHTKCTLVSPSQQGAEEWAAFIDFVTGGDVDFAGYLQRLLGMACIGEVYEEGLVISYGPGSNGKSTLFGAVQTALGDYAGTVNADVLVTTRGNTDQSYIASLRGKRLAVMGETEEGAHLANAQLKRLTSRDRIAARKLYKDPIEFIPTHTVIMHTNFLPRLASMDGGTKRRIAVAPFLSTRKPEQIITNYEKQLVDRCAPAILQWLIDGAVAFHKAGDKLEKCKVVRDATQAYTANEDWMGRFLEDCCEVGEKCTDKGADLYNRYVAWCRAENDYVRRKNDFAARLREKGFYSEHKMDGAHWYGLMVREEEA